MHALLAALAVLALFAGTIGGIYWIAHRVRTRGTGGQVLLPIMELYDPSVHRTQVQVQQVVERRAVTPAPGGPPVD